MQAEIEVERPDLDIQILSINMINNWSNGLTNRMGQIGNLPVVQDSTQLNIWQSWGGQWRDVVILDDQNQVVEYFDTNSSVLTNEQNYNALKQALINTAETQ